MNTGREHARGRENTIWEQGRGTTEESGRKNEETQ